MRIDSHPHFSMLVKANAANRRQISLRRGYGSDGLAGRRNPPPLGGRRVAALILPTAGL